MSELLSCVCLTPTELDAPPSLSEDKLDGALKDNNVCLFFRTKQCLRNTHIITQIIILSMLAPILCNSTKSRWPGDNDSDFWKISSCKIHCLFTSYPVFMNWTYHDKIFIHSFTVIRFRCTCYCNVRTCGGLICTCILLRQLYSTSVRVVQRHCLLDYILRQHWSQNHHLD